MSLRATCWAWTVPTSPTGKLVLLALADFADEVGHCWPGMSRLQEMTGLSERAVRTNLRALEAEGTIRTERGDGRGHTSRYALLINQRGQQMPPFGDGERGQQMPERGHEVPERGHEVPQRGQQMPPNRKEPPITVSEPKKGVALRAPAVPSVTLPDWMPAKAWNLYCRHRERIGKKTWTPDAIALTVRELGKFRDDGMDPAEVLEQSVANGWRGVFPLKGRPRQRPAEPPSKTAWMFDPDKQDMFR